MHTSSEGNKLSTSNINRMNISQNANTKQIKDLNSEQFNEKAFINEKEITVSDFKSLSKLSQPQLNRPNILWFKKVDAAFTELWRNAEQQTIPRFKRFYNLYTASFSLPLFGVIGVILILLGIYFYFHNKNVQELTITYKEEDGNNPIEFKVLNQIDPPIYLYYELKNFYANTRLYMRDSPSFIFSETTCTFLTTNKQAHDLRKINGKATLPELERDILTNEPIESNDKLAYPCGLGSVSLFNDKPRIFFENEEIPISITNLQNNWDLIQFLVPNSTSTDMHPWYLTYIKDYRIWLHPPFTSNFRKPFGTINTPLYPGAYTLVLAKNLWPSKEWNATKAFTLTTIKAAGGKNDFLFYSLLYIGGLYIFFAILLFLLNLSKIKIINSSYKIVDLPDLRR